MVGSEILRSLGSNKTITIIRWKLGQSKHSIATHFGAGVTEESAELQMASNPLIVDGMLFCGIFLVLSPLTAATCLTPELPIGRYSVQSSGGGSSWQSGEYSPGTLAVVSVNCDPGYIAQATTTSRCVDGVWTTPWPTCVAVQRPCPIPAMKGWVRQYVNGDETAEVGGYPPSAEAPEGSELISRCIDPGKFRLRGDMRRRCVSGVWTGVDTSCERVNTEILFKGVPRDIASNGTIFMYLGPAGDRERRLLVDCVIKRHIQGTAKLQAPHVTSSKLGPYDLRYLKDQRWRQRLLRRLWLRPPQIEHSGEFSCSSTSNTGNGESHSIQLWITDLECPAPYVPRNGRLIDEDTYWARHRYPITKEISFACDEDYRLVGYSHAVCTMGKWSHPTPTCIINRCPELPIPDHATMEGVYGFGRGIGDERIFHCDQGYILQGDNNLLRCLASGRWSTALPTCEPEAVAVRNPCEDVECEEWEKCVATDSGLVSCGCINPFSCRPAAAGDAVCGTDGRSYVSVCHLKALACLLDTGVEVASRGAISTCDGNGNGEGRLGGREETVTLIAEDSVWSSSEFWSSPN